MKKLMNNKKYLLLLVILLLLLIVVPSLPTLADRQVDQQKRVKITETKITKIKNKTYTGKKQIQKPVIMEGRYKLKLNTDYTLSYKGNINVGTASVIIKGKGKYSGTVTRKFQIKPAKTDLIDAVLVESSVTLTWAKNTGVDGYQIYYNSEKNGKFVQLCKVDKTITSYTVNEVKEGTWYYKIRAYQTVAGNTYYGEFSDAKLISNTTTHPTLPDPTDSEQPVKDGEITMNIKIGDTTFTATLENNDTVKALDDQLPLTINMSELNGNEKYYFLSKNVRADTSSYSGTINEGDLMLYDDDCLVLFYKTFHTSYNYVKLGHIDNSAGLAEAVGSGNIKITFSVNE